MAVKTAGPALVFRAMSPPMKTLLAMLTLVALPALADEAGGLSWKVPDAWKAGPPKPMRAATYAVAAAKGDAEDGELGVFYFGEGQGGGIDANIERWVGQFEGAPKATPKKEKIAGFQVTQVEVEGTYTASMGPMAPKANKSGFKLMGAIVEGPKGAVFFKLTGPKKTVEGAKGDLAKLLKSLKAG